MSQHVTNHSLEGSDSLLEKWNGFIGKCVKERKIHPEVSSVFLQMQIKFPAPLVGGYQAEECCSGPQESRHLFLQEESTRNSVLLRKSRQGLAIKRGLRGAWCISLAKISESGLALPEFNKVGLRSSVAH